MSSIPRGRAARLTLPLGLAVLALVWLAMLLLGTGRLDRQILEMLYAGGSRNLARGARLVTRLGDPSVMLAIGLVAAVYLAIIGRLRLGIAMTLAILTGRAMVEVQKFGVGRVRPGFEPHLVSAKTFSFVSGHAANSMIVLLALALAFVPEGRLRSSAIAVAVLGSAVIGLSRIMLGVHWPSDVLGGWAFGAFWVLATLKPAERLLAVPLRR